MKSVHIFEGVKPFNRCDLSIEMKNNEGSYKSSSDLIKLSVI